MNEQCRRDAAARRHTAECKTFLDMVAVAIPCGDSGSLLRGVTDEPPHLLGAETCRASRCGRRTERAADAVCAFVRIEYSGAQRREHPRAHVIAERHSANKVRAGDSEFLAHSKRRR